ncbi:MAG: oligosaccharide flippase family protein [Pseudomonadota bacterium]
MLSVSETTPVTNREKHGVLQRVITGVGWAFLGKVLGSASVLIVNAVLARHLSPEQMGAYFLLVSITAFGAIVARLGLAQLIVRVVAESMATDLPGRAGGIVRNSFFAIATAALILAGIYIAILNDWLAYSVFDSPLLGTVANLVACWIAILAIQTPVAEGFRGLHRIWLAVLFNGALASSILAALLLLLSVAGRELNFELAVFLTVLTAGVSLLLGALMLRRHRSCLTGRGDASFREMVSLGWPLYVTALSMQAIREIHLWIAGWMFLPGDVALFAAALKLVNLVNLPLMVMGMSIQPLIAELHVLGDRGPLQTALRGCATVAGFPALAVLCLFILTGDHVMALAYGEKYKAGGYLLVLLSIGALSNVATGVSMQVLAFTGHQRVLMAVTLISGIASTLLGLLGAYFFGLAGLAVGATVARVVQQIATWWIVWRLTGYWSHATVRPAHLKVAFEYFLRALSDRRRKRAHHGFSVSNELERDG